MRAGKGVGQVRRVRRVCRVRRVRRVRRVFGVDLAALALVSLVMLAGCGVGRGQWQAIGPGNNVQITTLTSDPHIRGIIYAGGSDGTTYVARGDRSGLFVASEKSPGHARVHVIFPNPFVSGQVYAGTDNGFFASSDYGVHYAAQGSGLPSSASITAITSGADATALFAAVAQSGLYTTSDGGKTWKAVTQAAATATTVPLPANAAVQALLWDGSSKSLYAAVTGIGDGLYVSHDNGATWTTGNDGLPVKTDVYALVRMDQGGMAPSGPTLYAATSSGVFALTSSTSQWQLASTGLPTSPVYSLAVYPATPGLLYAGTDQTVYSSTDGGWHWKKVAGGLSHAIPAIVVVPGQNTPTVTFAAAGQIARFPATTVGNEGIFSTVLLVLIVALVAWFILGRYGIVPSMGAVRARVFKRRSEPSATPPTTALVEPEQSPRER